MNIEMGKTAQPKEDGKLIVNADDWGRDTHTTNKTLDCLLNGAVSSVSAMVFMGDSERAADLAHESGVDAGLHLNLTSLYSMRRPASRLIEHQQRVSAFLMSNRLAPVIIHPGLRGSFEYLVEAQLQEYQRLYGAPVRRVDGHHHMHLCANVLQQKLLPPGIIVRRNFSFRQGEKTRVNRAYRRWQDKSLAGRYRLTDFFFALPPIETCRLAHILTLAHRYKVEVETHPLIEHEYRFLMGGGLQHRAGAVKIEKGYLL